MAINKVNTTAEEQSFKFLKNQSSILHTIDTNRVTVNGVNVIVDKPKRGDVMCITRYKENGVLLDANRQEVIWIDGLSIEPTQLSQEYEPVGICFAVNDNKALVRYREERGNYYWAVAKRYELQYSSIMNDGAEHNLGVTLEGDFEEFRDNILFESSDTVSRKAFVDKLNSWFLNNAPNHSAELVELDTDLPAVDTSDTKDGDSYRNRIIVSVSTVSSASTYSSKPIVMQPHSFAIEEIMSTDITANKIKGVSWYYKNNGFMDYFSGGCCRAIYYRYIQDAQDAPSEPMTDINFVPGATFEDYPACLIDFRDNEYCQILRDNFANYDEYFDSMMVKYPCGAGGVITEFPSGKENTYKLASCTYLNNTTRNQEILYPAANWAASISLNAPKLGKGNWWLPSAAEMAQMMRDITYYGSRVGWLPDELDIVNRVIAKLSSISNSGWSMIDGQLDRWTSSIFNKKFAYTYQEVGNLNVNMFNILCYVSPITIYEF